MSLLFELEQHQKLVIYEALYPPYKTCARPYSMFMSEVDREKYPNARQTHRFELALRRTNCSTIIMK